MTLGAWALLLPAIQLAAAAWLVHRIYWQRYRTLVPSLIVEALCAAAFIALPAVWKETGWAAIQAIILPVKGAVATEVFRIACAPLTRVERWHCGGIVTLFGGLGVQAAMIGSHLSVFASLLVFRQYYLLSIAVALSALVVIRWQHPAMENEEHMAFRITMTMQAVRVAISAMFVTGGIGYAMFPWTHRTWMRFDVAMWIAAGAITILQGWWMARSPSSRVPDWMREAKRAA